jgi:HTH-type transcriptional regulator/antitoxin HigA
MIVRLIRTDEDHAAALARIRDLWDAKPDSPGEEELGILAILVAAYEERRWPVPPLDPIAAILFHMEQNGLIQRDLGRVIGSESRASEILNRKRPLTVEQIRAIHRAWKIPLDILVGTGEPARDREALA